MRNCRPHWSSAIPWPLAALIAVVVLVVLVACAPPITSGRVLDKAHHAAETTLMPVMSCRPSGKTTVCTTTLIPIYHPETWQLDVKDADDHRGWVNVDATTYDATAVGDWWEASK